MISGESVYLKAIEPEDLKQLMEWRNIPEFRKHFREYREINSAMQKKWFDSISVDNMQTIMFSIFNRETNNLIGCCGLCYINWVYRNADLSIYIGHDRAYIDNIGFAEEACRLLFNYAFKEINLHKIWSELYEFDVKKIELYDKFGFKLDGTLRENYFFDGKWWDSKIFSLLASEFEK